MCKVVAIKTEQSGFTLFELLIVIVIISIITTCAVLALGDFGQTQRATTAAEQFVSLIKLSEEQAVLQATTLSIRLSNNGYQFYQYEPQDQNNWQLITKDPILTLTQWPSNIAAEFLSINHTQQTQQILIFPNGEISPFTLRLTDNGKSLDQIIGQQNGLITIAPLNT